MLPYNNLYIPQSFGLTNTGVLCYFNSLMQSLLSCPSFNQIILENDYALFKDLIKNKSSTTNAINIINSLIQKNKQENKKSTFGQRQEDTGECFHILLDTIPECKNLFKIRYNISIHCNKCENKLSESVDNILVIDIPLSISGPLEDYIKSFQTILTNYKCGHCNSTNVYKIYQLCKLSSIIVIQLNKFIEKKNIIYPQLLNFTHTNRTNLQYRLVSRIEHFGTMNSGHYTADCYRGEIKKFNDISVSSGNLEPTNDTYYLFYHLC